MIIWRRVWMVAGSLAAAAGLYFGLKPPSPEQALLRFLEKEYPKAKEVTIYSLDPQLRSSTQGVSNSEQLMGYDVLGKVNLTDRRDLEEVRLGMMEAIKSWSNQDPVSLGFAEPEHAFRITAQNDEVMTIVLAFDVSSFWLLDGRTQYSQCKIGYSGVHRLNAIVDRHKPHPVVPKDSNS